MIGGLLDHSPVQTTTRYAHLAKDSIQKTAARITGSIGVSLAPGERRAAGTSCDILLQRMRSRPLRLFQRSQAYFELCILDHFRAELALS